MINKKLVIGTVLVFSLALQVGCAEKINPKDLNSNKNIEEKTKENSKVSQDDNQGNEIMDEFNTIIEKDIKLDQVINFIDKNISLISKENGSMMINTLEEVQKKNLTKLEEKFYSDDNLQKKMYKIYNSDTDINIVDNIEDKELKALLTEVRDTGYRVETAEGTFFPIINYEFYKKYSSYVTSDMKDYIDIMTIESNEVPAKDGALIIGWDEVLKRALSQEKFIAQYSDSVKINDIKQLYKKYVTFTLFGLNNTPLFSYDSQVMVDDAKSTYINSIENGENSNLIEILREFLDILKKDNYRLTEEAKEYREEAAENII